MDAYIKTLQNYNKSEIIYPVTKAGAVYMDDNSATIQDVLQDVASKEYVDANSAPFIVTFSGSDSEGWTADKSVAEIRAAYEVNKTIYGKKGSSLYFLSTVSSQATFYRCTNAGKIEVFEVYAEDDILRDTRDLLLASGDTMTGDLTLVGDPTENFHAATKQYVDDKVSSNKGFKKIGEAITTEDSHAFYIELEKELGNYEFVLVKAHRLWHDYTKNTYTFDMYLVDSLTSTEISGCQLMNTMMQLPSAGAMNASSLVSISKNSDGSLNVGNISHRYNSYSGAIETRSNTGNDSKYVYCVTSSSSFNLKAGAIIEIWGLER